MVHVGVEAGDLLRPHRAGMARYSECLLTALRNLNLPIDARAWAPRRRVFGRVLRLFSASMRLPVHFFGAEPPRAPPDIFHATACVFPKWRSAFEVATVHDLYAVREELRLSPMEIEHRTAFIHRADKVICVSQHTRNHLHSLLDIPLSKSVAIPLAAESHFVPASAESQQRLRRKLRLPREFLLFVGRYRPN